MYTGTATGGCYQGQIFQNIYNQQEGNFRPDADRYMITFPHPYCVGTGCNKQIQQINQINVGFFNIN